MQNYFTMQFTPQQVNQMSNLALAHLGDGVFELMCRAYLCEKGSGKVQAQHKATVELVNAAAQAKLAQALQPELTEAEKDYFRRGKNAHTHAAPKAATAKEYAYATGLETLFGALYLQGQLDRLNQLFAKGMEGTYGL